MIWFLRGFAVSYSLTADIEDFLLDFLFTLLATHPHLQHNFLQAEAKGRQRITRHSIHHTYLIQHSKVFLVIKVPARNVQAKNMKKISIYREVKVRAVKSKLNSPVASPSSFHLFSQQLSFPPFSPLRAATWIQVVASLAASPRQA